MAKNIQYVHSIENSKAIKKDLQSDFHFNNFFSIYRGI